MLKMKKSITNPTHTKTPKTQTFRHSRLKILIKMCAMFLKMLGVFLKMH